MLSDWAQWVEPKPCDQQLTESMKVTIEKELRNKKKKKKKRSKPEKEKTKNNLGH